MAERSPFAYPAEPCRASTEDLQRERAHSASYGDEPSRAHHRQGAICYAAVFRTAASSPPLTKLMQHPQPRPHLSLSIHLPPPSPSISLRARVLLHPNPLVLSSDPCERTRQRRAGTRTPAHLFALRSPPSEPCTPARTYKFLREFLPFLSELPSKIFAYI